LAQRHGRRERLRREGVTMKLKGGGSAVLVRRLAAAGVSTPGLGQRLRRRWEEAAPAVGNGRARLRAQASAPVRLRPIEVREGSRVLFSSLAGRAQAKKGKQKGVISGLSV